MRIARRDSWIAFACAWCGSHRGSGDRTPQIRQGLGNLLILSPTFTLEPDRRCVEDSHHYLRAVSAAGLMLFTLDASGNGYGHRAVRAFVFVGRHLFFFLFVSC